MGAPIGHLYSGFNISAPGANTGIVNAETSSALNVRDGRLRITIALTTSSVVNVTCTDGSTTHKWGLNSSSALNAADLYSFELGCSRLSGATLLSWDVEIETDGVIELLVIENPVGKDV